MLVAQSTIKIWYFGEFAGLDFRSGAPRPLLHSAMKSYEGSTVITDNQENLLFYTNGEKVWNKFHQIMHNGDSLNGNTDCVNPSTIIMNKYLGVSVYYIFTCDALGRKKGLQYSIVDMNKQAGLGEVVKKNVFLKNNLTEKVVAISHSNGCDAWLICHEFRSDRFLIYPITETGVGTPLIQSIGSIQPFGNIVGSGSQGQIATSPDGSMIAMASYGLNEFQIFKFNKTNGTLSDPITIRTYSNPWGVVFSPNSKKLYTSQGTNPYVYQFDLYNYDSTAINSSSIQLGELTCPDSLIKVGAMQLGPDNKIYIPKWNSNYLSRIEEPNLSGKACKLLDSAVFLGGRKSLFGLPNQPIVPSNKKVIVVANLLGQDTSLCPPLNYKLSVNHQSPIWYDSSYAQEVLINKAGKYWVSFEECDTIYTDTIEITEILSTLDAGVDTNICEGSILHLVGRSTGLRNFVWHSSHGNFNNSNELNTYFYSNFIGSFKIYLEAIDDCKIWVDSINITVIPNQTISVKVDSLRNPCGQSTFIASGGKDYVWTPSSGIDCLDTSCSRAIIKSTEVTRFTITGVGPCVVPAILDVSKEIPLLDFFIPNVFSPNGDNINDIFQPVLNCEKIIFYNLQIYNRWGKLLFESQNKENGWNGKHLDLYFAPGVYTYIIQYQIQDSRRKVKVGNLTLIR